MDAEKLLELLNEPTDVNDKPGAPDLVVNDGEIEFGMSYCFSLSLYLGSTHTDVDNVSFTYNGRQNALRGVSFRVPKGGSVALVGESGAGKSTILRLLYRFYDLKENQGRILIDGQDIRDVTQESLRKAIGVVPQDAILFNSSIAYNIRCVHRKPLLARPAVLWTLILSVLAMASSEQVRKNCKTRPKRLRCTIASYLSPTAMRLRLANAVFD